ncbi:MAG TPA: hypothetical protein PKK00_12555 [Bacteroidales bacterium]|nr:hypothetical protein [Bacteroidales bacterium]HPS18055.1 hypothetical protein [Bacteroidales bacterium]
MKSKKENIFILISGIAFLVLFGICSYFNRFAVDDYYHIHNEHILGIWGGMLEGYNNWGGRWTSYLLWNTVYHFHDNRSIIFIYTFLIILFFILAIYGISKELFSFSGIYNTRHSALMVSLLFSVFFFLFSFNKGEVWFWIVSTAMYIVSLIFFLFILRLIISTKRKILLYLLLIIFSIYAGGASEIYAFFYILILLSLFIVTMVFPKDQVSQRLKETSLIKIIIALIFTTTAFIISVKAPGNAIRTSWLPEPSFSKTIYITFKELAKIILFKFSLQLHWAVLFSIPFMYVGFIHGINSDIIPLKKIIKPLMISFLGLFILIYILLFPSCYILSEAGPDRSLSMIIISVAIFIAGWSYRIGKCCIKSNRVIQKLFYVSMSLIIVFIIYLCYQQYNTLSKYAAALDKRSELLQQLQQVKNKKTIVVSPLPSNGYLYSAEISNDTNYFSNEHYRLGLFLDFKVKKE